MRQYCRVKQRCNGPQGYGQLEPGAMVVAESGESHGEKVVWIGEKQARVPVEALSPLEKSCNIDPIISGYQRSLKGEDIQVTTRTRGIRRIDYGDLSRVDLFRDHFSQAFLSLFSDASPIRNLCLGILRNVDNPSTAGLGDSYYEKIGYKNANVETSVNMQAPADTRGDDWVKTLMFSTVPVYVYYLPDPSSTKQLLTHWRPKLDEASLNKVRLAIAIRDKSLRYSEALGFEGELGGYEYELTSEALALASIDETVFVDVDQPQTWSDVLRRLVLLVYQSRAHEDRIANIAASNVIYYRGKFPTDASALNLRICGDADICKNAFRSYRTEDTRSAEDVWREGVARFTSLEQVEYSRVILYNDHGHQDQYSIKMRTPQNLSDYLLCVATIDQLSWALPRFKKVEEELLDLHNGDSTPILVVVVHPHPPTMDDQYRSQRMVEGSFKEKFFIVDIPAGYSEETLINHALHCYKFFHFDWAFYDLLLQEGRFQECLCLIDQLAMDRYDHDLLDDALDLAVYANSSPVVCHLLSLGANPLGKGIDKISPMSIAIREKRVGIMLEMLNSFTEENKETLAAAQACVDHSLAVRVALMGPPGAGKSTLLHLLQQVDTNGKDFGVTERSEATDGIGIARIENSRKAVPTEFWDFGGQEVFFMTHEMFLAGKVLYIVTVNGADLMSKRPATRSITISDLTYWLDTIAQFIGMPGDPLPILCMTHCDLLGDKELKQAKEEFLGLVKGANITAYEKMVTLSAKKAKKCAMEIYKEVQKAVLPMYEAMSKLVLGKGVDSQWLRCLHAVRDLATKEYMVPWSSYRDLCKLYGLEGKALRAFSAFLVEIGQIVTHGQKSTGAPAIVALDSRWLSDMYTSVISISFMSSTEKRGFLSKEKVRNEMRSRGATPEVCEKLLRLFTFQQLIHEVNDDSYYVPALRKSTTSNAGMVKERIDEHWRELNRPFQRIYKLTTRNDGFYEKCIVRLLHQPSVTLRHDLCARTDTTFQVGEDRFIRITIENLQSLCIMYYSPHVDDSIICEMYFVFAIPRDLVRTSYAGKLSIEKTRLIRGKLELNGGTSIVPQLFVSSGEDEAEIRLVAPDLCAACVDRITVPEGAHMKLGSGTFGDIYKAEMDGKAVALKELRKLSGTSTEEVIHELMMMKIIGKSPYVVDLLGLMKRSNGPMSIVLELAPLRDLTYCHEMMAGKLALQVKIAYDIARGIKHIHENDLRIIHRDIRGPNVFMFSVDESTVFVEGIVHAKVGDVGASVIASPTVNETLGNWQYMPPEAFRGAALAPYNQSVDIYAFGIVLWEILHGKIPFSEMDRDQENQIIHGYRPPIDSTTPPELAQLMKQCWMQKPSLRPQAKEVCTILESVLLSLS